MPRNHDDDLEEVEEIEEIEEVEELDEIEEVDDFDEEVEEVDEFEDVEELDEADGEAQAPARRTHVSNDGTMKRLIKQLLGAPQRPGEQDVLRSPLVLWLAAGSIVVGLLSLVLYIMIGQKSSAKRFAEAETEMKGQKYAQAIQLFSKFIEQHPDDELTDNALINLGRCRIEKELSGADPNVVAAYDEMDNFYKARQKAEKETQNLAELKPEFRQWSIQLAMKAARKAAKSKDQAAREVSDKAENMMKGKFKPKDGFKKEILTDLDKLQLLADRAIFKATTSKAAIDNIKKLTKDKQTIAALAARRALIQQFSKFGLEPKTDKDLGTLLTDIRSMERDLVAVDTTVRDALTEDRPAIAPSLTLAPHTRTSSQERSEGRLAIAVAADCLYGIDTVTGIPQWRRVIGLNTPFTPIHGEASESAILVFDTNHGELILVKRKNGELLWRLPLNGEMPRQPLVNGSQILLPTDGSNLYAIGFGTGRVSARATFSQPVVGPPAMTGDGKHIVIPGEEEIVYTLQLRPLKCTEVAWIGHKAGTVNVPLIKMGNILLMVENSSSEESTLRVLRGELDGSKLATATNSDGSLAISPIEGEVLEPPVLRGKKLFVPSNPQRITVFAVSDSPDDSPITLEASNQLQNPEPTAMFMFLVPRSGDNVFLAGTSLRKFSLRSNTLVIDQKETAVGVHLQPPQVIDDDFFMTRREPIAQSVYFTRADSQTMTSSWRVVLGLQILAFTQQAGQMIAVSDTGAVCRVREDEIRSIDPKDVSTQFNIEATAQGYLPKNLKSPIGAAAVGNRVAVYWGGSKPQIVFVSESGQPGSATNLPGPLEAKPVAVAGGVVLPVPGGLKFVADRRGAGRVVDYAAPTVQGVPSRWKSLTRLDDTQVAGIDTRNRMIQVQLRTAGRPSLAEVRIVELDAPVDHAPTRFGNFLLIADTQGTVSVLDAASLEIRSSQKLTAPATSSVFGVGDRVFVEIGTRQIACLKLDNAFQQTGSIDTKGVALAGAPIAIGTGYLVALQSGDLVFTDAEGNEAGKRINVGQAVQSGPFKVGELTVILGVDGSVLHLDPILGGQ